MDERNKQEMLLIRNKWDAIFPARLMRTLDAEMWIIDRRWPHREESPPLSR